MAGILFATHGGPTAEGAARIAKLLAERLGTSLHTLCVIEPLPAMDSGFSGVYVPTQEDEDAARVALCASAAEQLRRTGASGSPEARFGPAASEIAHAARRLAAEVIIVGLGPHHFVDRALGHETVLQLVQLASTPVLAVPATMSSLPHRVVAAIDFSTTSIASAQNCARWLVDGDVIQLVHVAGVSAGELPSALRARLQDALGALASEVAVPPGVAVEITVVEGEPAEQLLAVADGTNADLVALGSHGYGLWKRLTLGSVASKIIRLSPKAVLVTPIGSSTGDAAQPVAQQG